MSTALENVKTEMQRRIGGAVCLSSTRDLPESYGVLAWLVCGLPDGHPGDNHRAGWSGTGDWFKA